MVHRLLMLLTLIAMAFFGWLLSAYAEQTPAAQTKRHELFSNVGALGGIFMMTNLTIAILTLFDYLDGFHIEWTRWVVLLQWLSTFSLRSARPLVFQIYCYRVYITLLGRRVFVNSLGLFRNISFKRIETYCSEGRKLRKPNT